MKKLMIATVAICGFILFNSTHSYSQALYFFIENKTGFTLNEINVTPAETADWGSDILPNDLLYNNNKVEVNIPATYGSTCFFDLRISDLEGGAVIYYNLDACKLLTITIYADGTADLLNE